MPDIALYYPYTHIRDEAWLKAAALYLPKLALLAPDRYPRRLSRTADVLREELGFLVDVNPTRRASIVATEFLKLINHESDALRTRYAWPAELPPDLHASLGNCRPHYAADERVEWIHIGKVSSGLIEALTETRLAVPSEDSAWIALHPRLASVYLSALADRVAQANDMPVVTDQPPLYGTLNGWGLDTLTRVLLGNETSDSDSSDRSTDAIAATYAAIAIQTVVPERLDDIPVEKIVHARRTLAAEFDAFCVHLESLADQFSALTQIEDPAVLRARLEVLVGRDLRRPTAELEKGLQQLGLQPTRAVLGMKSLELPAVAATAASGVGLPVVAGQAGLVAAQFIASSVQARRVADERGRSAAGYLLGLRSEFNPSGVVDRVRRMFQRASTPRP